MSTPTVGGLASVIIPCWNQLEFTRKCLHALFRQTAPSWELVVIDNGSTDGTGSYLAGVQDASPVPVTVIANGTNRGFPAAINQGLQYARGEYLVLLNNDVVVTEGWLSQLIGLASVAPTTEMSREADQGVSTTEHTGSTESKREDQPRLKEVTGAYPGRNVTVIDLESENRNGAEICKGRVGMVGPMSNYAAPPQLVESVPYRDLSEMSDFARRWRDEHLGQWFTVPKLSGFCLLMKRAVYDAIGRLDERFGLGFFPDPIRLDKVIAENREPKSATFINPQPEKGAAVFARIALELGRRRPDIPLFIIEGRGKANGLAGLPVDLSCLTNLNRMANTPDPRDFYGVSRAALMPSLWRESLGRVPIEAMANGIPVLASDRGALPETLGDAGFVFTIPDRWTPASGIVPTAQEIAPWVAVIERLWDDPGFEAEHGRLALTEARRWEARSLADQYEEFFLSLASGRQMAAR
jgi:GT2 family glycosyltransferase